MQKFPAHITMCIGLVLLSTQYANAQTVLLGPANGGDFELSGTSSFPANGWSSAMPTTNRWVCNVSATGNATHSAYIRVNTASTTHAYDNTVTSVTHIWRDIAFPAGDYGITLQFDWIGIGEQGYDRLKVFLVNTGTTPVAGTALATGQIGASEYSNQSGWATTSITIPASWAGSTGRLVFSWENDYADGSNPPAAIDNIVVTSSPVVLMPPNGSTTLSVCNMNFYDSGGPDSNYASSENGVLTLCPSSPGTYTSISFSSFGMENRADFLFIYDGPTTNDRLIAGYNGFSVPATVTASTNNPGGCLTLKFVSNWNGRDAGWSAFISCAASGGLPPSYPDNRDCYNSTLVCSDANIGGNNTGAGMGELFSNWVPCAYTGEDQANWFYFRMTSGGTVGLAIDPGPTIDYDFAIWGPYSSLMCPVNTFDNPVRCSYSQYGGLTGLVDTASDVSEDANGDKWVQSINVNAGELYVLYINNYSISSTAFTLAWNLTNGASLNCTPLPVEISSLEGQRTEKGNLINWETTSEYNSGFFEIQRSTDLSHFETIKTIPAIGHSRLPTQYNHLDESCGKKGYYYRLKERDMDGTETLSNTIYIESPKDVSLARVYPVPVQDLIWVDIQSRTDGKIQVDVIDALGNSVYTHHQYIHQGNTTIVVNSGDLNPGTYFIRITSAEDHVQQGFVKTD